METQKRTICSVPHSSIFFLFLFLVHARYNDVQCGNGPPNWDVDEHLCPGRVDLGPGKGCGHIGPKWDLDSLASATNIVKCEFINPRFETAILDLVDGGSYTFSQLGITKLNVECTIKASAGADSVLMQINGPVVQSSNDSFPPYTVCGKRVLASGNINYFPCGQTFSAGTYTLQVTPSSGTFALPTETFTFTLA